MHEINSDKLEGFFPLLYQQARSYLFSCLNLAEIALQFGRKPDNTIFGCNPTRITSFTVCASVDCGSHST